MRFLTFQDDDPPPAACPMHGVVLAIVLLRLMARTINVNSVKAKSKCPLK